MSLILGVDSAMAKTGIALLDTSSGHWGITTINLGERVGRSFGDNYKTAKLMASKVDKELSQISGEVHVSVLETPPPNSLWSSGLSVNDSFVLEVLVKYSDVILVPCTKIHSLIGKRGSKSDTEIAVRDIAKFNNYHDPQKKLNDDESDASMLAMWGAYLNKGFLLPYNFDNKRWDTYLSVLMDNDCIFKGSHKVLK